MATVLNALSTGITALDGNGVASDNRGTNGQFQKGFIREHLDILPVSATLFSAIGNYARVLRLPADATIHELEMFSDVALDSNATSLLKFDIGVAFSDDPADGTPPGYVGLVPTTVGTGTTPGTTTPFSTYATPNKIFGNWDGTIADATKIPPTSITFQGITSQYTMAAIVGQPLVANFNFLDARLSAPLTNLGFLDIYVYCTAAAATPAAGNLGFRARYVT